MTNRWGNNGNSDRLYFLGLQNHCGWWLQPSHEIKRHLFFGRTAMTNLDSILKSRDIHRFADKGLYHQNSGFSNSHEWIWELDHKEGWQLKNCCFWTARRSNQSILRENNPEYSLEGLMLKLKLQYLGHLMQNADSLEKTLMLERWRAGGEEGDRGWDGWMASPTQWTWVWANSRRWWRTGKPGVLQSVGSQRVGPDWETGPN